jgi:beta-lactamase class A
VQGRDQAGGSQIYAPALKPITSPDAEISPPRRQRHEQSRKARRWQRRRRRRFVAFVILVFVLLGLAFLPFLQGEPVSRAEIPAAEPPAIGPLIAASPPAGPVGIGELQDELEKVAASYPGVYGIVVFEPSSGKTVALNAHRTFAAASLGKLPTLMALYRAAARDVVNLDDKISILPSDVEAYGTGVLYKYPIGHTMTLRECASYLIKESDNTAWKMFTRYLGSENIQAELYRIGADSTSYWHPNTTTPSDVALMLKKIADPAYTSPDLSAEMLDLMTNTDFEARLPAPLPNGTRVAHKIGSYGSTFSDAGVVFPEGSHNVKDAYFMVVIASGASEDTAREAIQEMSLITYRSLISPDLPLRPTGRGNPTPIPHPQ